MGVGYCDGHGCDRSDVRSCGVDSNGDPDAPDLCFLCRKEGERGRLYDRKLGRYVRPEQSWHQVRGEVAACLQDRSVPPHKRVTRRQAWALVRQWGPHIPRRLQLEMVDSLFKD